MFLFKLFPLLSIVAAAGEWPALKTTWGFNIFGSAFHDRPRTVAEAEKDGWTLIGSCDGQWLGHRYADPADPSLLMIYDDAGYIAGVQSGLLKSDVDESVGNFANLPIYQSGDFFGEPAYFTTAYFVDPEVICNGGRTEDDFNKFGTGDRLLFQVGATPDQLYAAPLTQDEADANSDWYDHYCFLGMGDHYIQYNYTPDQDCAAVLPIQVLYDQGVLNGFVWQHLAGLPGDKWEHPDETAIGAIIDRPPTCLLDSVAYPGLSTMHHYFYSYPWLVLCPLKHDRGSLNGYIKVMKKKFYKWMFFLSL